MCDGSSLLGRSAGLDFVEIWMSDKWIECFCENAKMSWMIASKMLDDAEPPLVMAEMADALSVRMQTKVGGRGRVVVQTSASKMATASIAGMDSLDRMVSCSSFLLVQ